MTPRTKIYLTIAGLLTLTGVLYASNPSVFVMPGHGVSRPISPAVFKASPIFPDGQFYVTQYENGQIEMVIAWEMARSSRRL